MRRSEMNRRKGVGTVIVAAFSFAIVFSLVIVSSSPASGQVNPYVEQLYFSDDFSANTGWWNYYWSAGRSGNVLQVTGLGGSQRSIAWFSQPVTSTFTIVFDWYIGGGSGADGMVFMFYKQDGYEAVADNGGFISFTQSGGNPVPGYGIEFDSYPWNGWDPPYMHIALVKDTVSNHLALVGDGRVRDGSWHTMKVSVGQYSVKVWVDPNTNPTPLLTWDATIIDRNYGRLGFGAGTGGSDDNHLIDNVRLYTPQPVTENMVVETAPTSETIVTEEGSTITMAPSHAGENQPIPVQDPTGNLMALMMVMGTCGIVVLAIVMNARKEG